jgi:hypothetical protein
MDARCASYGQCVYIQNVMLFSVYSVTNDICHPFLNINHLVYGEMPRNDTHTLSLASCRERPATTSPKPRNDKAFPWTVQEGPKTVAKVTCYTGLGSAHKFCTMCSE